MSVADEYPARTDSNGLTWFRPVRDKGVDVSQWGWTSGPLQAHPDYQAVVAVPSFGFVHSRRAARMLGCDRAVVDRMAALGYVQAQRVHDGQGSWVWALDAKRVDELAAANDATGLHPEWACGRDCSGCVSEGEGAAPPVRQLGDPQALSDVGAFGVSYVAVLPPAVADLVPPVGEWRNPVKPCAAAVSEAVDAAEQAGLW